MVHGSWYGTKDVVDGDAEATCGRVANWEDVEGGEDMGGGVLLVIFTFRNDSSRVAIYATVSTKVVMKQYL